MALQQLANNSFYILRERAEYEDYLNTAISCVIMTCIQYIPKKDINVYPQCPSFDYIIRFSGYDSQTDNTRCIVSKN